MNSIPKSSAPTSFSECTPGMPPQPMPSEENSVPRGSTLSSAINCDLAAADYTVIDMDTLPVEGTGVTPGAALCTPGEGYVDTATKRDSYEITPDGRARTVTHSTNFSDQSAREDLFADEEDTSMELYEDTFEKLEREGTASTGDRSKPRSNQEGGMVTGFDAQHMMRQNVVECSYDNFDLTFNEALKRKKQQRLPEIHSGKKLSLFGDTAMDHAMDLPIDGLDSITN